VKNEKVKSPLRDLKFVTHHLKGEARFKAVEDCDLTISFLKAQPLSRRYSLLPIAYRLPLA